MNLNRPGRLCRVCERRQGIVGRQRATLNRTDMFQLHEGSLSLDTLLCERWADLVEEIWQRSRTMVMCVSLRTVTFMSCNWISVTELRASAGVISCVVLCTYYNAYCICLYTAYYCKFVTFNGQSKTINFFFLFFFIIAYMENLTGIFQV